MSKFVCVCVCVCVFVNRNADKIDSSHLPYITAPVYSFEEAM